MLDLKEIRRDPDAARAALERRRAGDKLDELLRLDERRRELLPQEESLRAEQNQANQRIKQADASERQSLIDEMKQVSARVKELAAERTAVDEQLDGLLAGMPNLPLESSPADEE